MKNTVPFLDLAAAHAELEEELIAVFRSALQTACFIGGPMVESPGTAFRRLLRHQVLCWRKQRN